MSTKMQRFHSFFMADYEDLQASHSELVEFKNQVEDAKKDAMIEKFYMLSEEDKKEIVANKTKFSVEEIEEKLSVICFRKKVNFDSEDSSKINNKTEPMTVSYSHVGSTKPAWLSAVDNIKNK